MSEHEHARVITEAEAERMVDARVMHRLSTDNAYRYAEDAESQSQREAAITEEVWADIERKFSVS